MSIDVLQTKIRKMKNPSMVGLDPILDLLPTHIREQAYAEHGETLKGAAEAYRVFCFGILDALKDIVPATKVQTGCFQALGFEGVRVMEAVIQYAKDLGYYVLMDTMRGDIDCTAEALAQSYFGGVKVGENTYLPYPCDAVMTNSYLGSDGIMPFTRYCKEGKNVFLLAKTSNKSSREVQDLLSGDRIVYQVIMDLAMRWSIDLFGKNGYSEIAVAVSGKHPKVLEELRRKYDRLFFLIPGYGAQGANGRDVQYGFDRFGHGAVVCAGRSILYAYAKHGSTGEDYAACAREAAERMKEDIGKFVTVL
ncbi:MAG: orotidine-5'-phosphate decarboxylase [Oscillospiraceae bacterium]|nr:orotidine-5'-phosphate decarboxylase [Oscillospiraceae bacterium]